MSTALGILLVVLIAATVVRVRDAREWGAHAVPRLVPAGTRFFADPSSSAAQWVRAHPYDDRAATIGRVLVSSPQAVWLTEGDPETVRVTVHEVAVTAAARSEIPVLVMYAIPHRDCASASAGGTAGLGDYQRWVDGFSRGLGSHPAWVILEPDALAQVDCLAGRQRAARFRALSGAARTLREHNRSARIYFDAGNSSWHSPEKMAARLRRAHVKEYGDGISVNVANFKHTDAEVRFGLDVIRSLGDRDLRMVVDTGRNGTAGPLDGQTCDPAGLRLGARPTADTGNAWVDAFLWVKPPGQSDGCSGPAGTFLPEEAYALAVRDLARGGSPRWEAEVPARAHPVRNRASLEWHGSG